MPTLSKSNILSGLKCHRRLWWRLNEAPPKPWKWAAILGGQHKAVVDAFLAQQAPGVEPKGSWAERVNQTLATIKMGDKPIHRACLETANIRLEIHHMAPSEQGWSLTEVRGSGSIKGKHTTHAALMVFTLQEIELLIADVFIAHIDLRGHNDHPKGAPPFRTVRVTDKALKRAADLNPAVSAIQTALEGPLPDANPGSHCKRPYPCRHLERCFPAAPPHGIHELYRVKAKVLKKLSARGISQIVDVPEDAPLPEIARRQREAVCTQGIVVNDGLMGALEAIQRPTVYLDFEAISPAMPPWPDCPPFTVIPVQVSLHRLDNEGKLSHTQWMAKAGSDPREGLAQFLSEHIKDAATLVAYHASFETKILQQLSAFLPSDAAQILIDAKSRFVDLLPLIRNHVYHPGFRGRFGLKVVVEALLPALSYKDLSVNRGDEASMLLEAVILRSEPNTPSEKAELIAALYQYCGRDTLVMVHLEALLRTLAESQATA
jgi:hypothetical protein